ncbi:MAG TPA: KpsF/GutQ family sugar-phosphate isomerase [Haliscomenobacter sp.]|uniref:KpsF/GutQ family sugar-phosphate isomerase n=1 Tax=Haliscomenobacter sp. TaxID=2717303 RepID=UPI002B834286|nr:KpsF/GutQ family sugar-phosphate isomerase [Haliscomenobacter sp.]HOY19771.1 KpsF/GutQ family sugar-phosphate isomerase [Haliscomenobacter sp.]HPH19669.1 KpsF/GutQ family sugar-phosphate isomerase [Haliscomenobacter sp.]
MDTLENIILSTARQTIEIEVATLQDLRNSLDEGFVTTVEAIYAATGRVILTGIGKSAIIAQKIVATLNSTGTPAIFLHAADAIHGDLGMIQAQDVVICLSKSGETPEIKVLVPLIKNLGTVLIGMVSNKDSYLAKQAQFILHTPIDKEADPNNLAPTASTTAQMAMGDALATSLCALRGFSPKDFAQFHPGGSLGKQLYLRVSDLYIHNARPMVEPTTGIKRTILEITSKRLGATAVVDTDEKVLGIVTDGDLRRMLERLDNWAEVCAQDIMSAHPKTIFAHAMAVHALEIMRNYSISQLLVVDEVQKYVGVVHLHDLIREGIV